jgi:hypothetical protein
VQPPVFKKWLAINKVNSLLLYKICYDNQKYDYLQNGNNLQSLINAKHKNFSKHSKTSLGHLIPWVDGMMGRDSGVSCCSQV